jgi:CRISPR system Cascade subunit CasA
VAYDLRFESWIPFRRSSGQVDWLPPFGLTDRLAEDPIVAVACPRPDFDAALLEFLVGLCSVALAPADEAAWAELWRVPPTQDDLRAALARLPDAFCLDGEGARMFQDRDALEGVAAIPIENLLIDSVGEQTRRHNADIFVKRDRLTALGRPASAMALITMQSFAPSGGAGHRTSLRGGGPLSTLVEPRADVRVEPLWRLVWANVETEAQSEDRDADRARAWTPADVFPWLAPTRQSNAKEAGGPTRPTDAAPAQSYFGLPRRIRLEITDSPVICGLTGRPDTAQVSTFRMQTYGVQYAGWIHPLTPYYYDKHSGLLPVHGQPGGVGWRDWLGLLFDSANEAGSRPAQAVAQYRAHRASGAFRLRVSGYDVDNMKARAWIQAELPAFPEEILERLRAFAADATSGADQAASATMIAVKAARLQRPKDAPGDYRYLKQEFWAATQTSFFELVDELARQTAPDGPAMRERFRQRLRHAALVIFDRSCPLEGEIEMSYLRRPIAARHILVMTLEGYGKSGMAFFKSLNLPTPRTVKMKSVKAA